MAKRTTRRTANGGDPATIVLEDIRAQNKVVIEAVLDLGRKLDRDINHLRSELLERIAVLEAAVRQNSADIRAHSETLRAHGEILRGHTEAIRRLEGEVREIKELVSKKADASALAALEQRVAALERRVGI